MSLIVLLLGRDILIDMEHAVVLVCGCLAAVVLAPAIAERRTRLIVDVLGVVAISLLLRLGRTPTDALVFLYVFPILSAIRNLGLRWGAVIALLGSVGYWWAFETARLYPMRLSAFAFAAAILVGIAFSAAKLAGSRDRALARHDRTADQVLANLVTDGDLKSVIQPILATALTMTRSDMSAIAFVEDGAITEMFVKTSTTEEDIEQDATRILAAHFRDVILCAPSSLPVINHSWITALLRARAGTEPSWHCQLIPLGSGKTPFGVLGVFSRRSVHYTSGDVERLSSLTPLIALAKRNVSLTSRLAVRDKESRTRLEVLYHISDQLRADEGIPTLFRSAVEMVSQHIGSEEAALFLPDPPASYLRKAAVAGPDPETTAHLTELELTQERESLTGRVFQERRSLLENDISSSEPHAKDYSRVLPSGVTRHYMGAPLMIGEQVMGVIRVLNKTARSSSSALDAGGFTTDDLDLLTAIATHIASAIRNATNGEKNRHFERLVDTSPDPIIIIDGDGRVQNFNNESEKIWGVAEKDVIGRTADILYESLEHAREIDRALRDAPDHMIRAFAVRVRSSSGEIIPMRLSANLLFGRDGERASSIGIFKDAREMIRIEELRVRDEKIEAIGRLAQTTGHDLKHDLGAVLGFVEVLEESDRDDPSTSELYAGVRTAAIDALQKVQNMLLVANRRAPELERVSLRSLIKIFAKSVEYRVLLAEIVFEIVCVDDKVEILGEPDQLRQVLANLFGNSLHAIRLARQEGRSASRIAITTTLEEGNARIVWSDDGIGFAEDVGSKLFTPFFTTKSTGSGLGLFITKSIIERHGGRIRRLPSDGDGMSMEILLPLHRDL